MAVTKIITESSQTNQMPTWSLRSMIIFTSTNSFFTRRSMDKKLKLEGLPKKYQKILVQFYEGYKKAIAPNSNDATLQTFRELLEKQLKDPFVFEPYHQKVREPIDYYKFSLDFIRPLIDLPHSRIEGLDVLEKIDQQLKRKEN